MANKDTITNFDNESLVAYMSEKVAALERELLLLKSNTALIKTKMDCLNRTIDAMFEYLVSEE